MGDGSDKKARLPFPVGGISDVSAFIDQPGDQCPPDSIINCIPFDTAENRQRGGKRPGVRDAFPGFRATNPNDGSPAFIQSMVSLALAQRIDGYSTGDRVDLIGSDQNGGGTTYTSILEDADTWFIDNLNVMGTTDNPPPIYASKSLDNLFDTYFGRCLDGGTPFGVPPADANKYNPSGSIYVGLIRNYGAIRSRWATRSTATYNSGASADSDTLRVVNNICFRESNYAGTTYSYAQGRFVVTVIDRLGAVLRSWMVFDANLRTTGTPIAATLSTRGQASGISGYVALTGLHLATLDNNAGGQDRPWHLICNDVDVGPEWTYFALTAFQSLNGSPPASSNQGSTFPDDDSATVFTRAAAIAASNVPAGSALCRGWVLAIRNSALVGAGTNIGTTDYRLMRVTRGVSGLSGPSAWSPTDSGAGTHADLASECTAVRYRGFEALEDLAELDVNNPRLTENYRARVSSSNSEANRYPWLGMPWRTGGAQVLLERAYNQTGGVYNGWARVSFGGRPSEVAVDGNMIFGTVPGSGNQSPGPAVTIFGPSVIFRPTSQSATAFSTTRPFDRHATFRDSPLRFDAQDHLGYRFHLGDSVTQNGIRTQYVLHNPTAVNVYRTTPLQAPAGRYLPWMAITGVTGDNSLGRKVDTTRGTERLGRDGDLNPDVVVAFAGQYDFQSGVARFKPDLSEKWRLGEMPHPYNPGHGPIYNNGQGNSPTLTLPLLNGAYMNYARGAANAINDITSVEHAMLDFLIDKDHATARISVLWAPIDTRFNMARGSIADCRMANATDQRDGRNNYNRSAQGAYPSSMDVDPWGMIYLGTSRQGSGYGIPLMNPPPNDWTGGSLANDNNLANRLPANSGIYKKDSQLTSSTNAMGYGSAYPSASLQNQYGGSPTRFTVTVYGPPNTVNTTVLVQDSLDYGNVPANSQAGANVMSIAPDGFALQALIAAPATGVLPYQYPDNAVFPIGATSGSRVESEVTEAFATNARKYLNAIGDRFLVMVRGLCWWPRTDDPNNTSLAVATRFVGRSNAWIVRSANGAQVNDGASANLTYDSSGVPGMGFSSGEVVRADRIACGAPEWAEGLVSVVGSTCTRNGAFYLSKTAHTASNTTHPPPPGNTTDWDLISAGNPTRTLDINGATKYQPKNIMPFTFGSKSRGAVPIGPLTKITSGSTRENLTLGKFELYANSVAAYFGEPAVIFSTERFSPKNVSDFAWNANGKYLVGDTVLDGTDIYRCIVDIAAWPATVPNLDATHWRLVGTAASFNLTAPAGIDTYLGQEIRRAARPILYKVMCNTRSWLDGFCRGVYARVLGICIDTKRDPEMVVGSVTKAPGSYLGLVTPEANRNSNASFSSSNTGTAPGSGEDGDTATNFTRDSDLSGTIGGGNSAHASGSSGGGGGGKLFWS